MFELLYRGKALQSSLKSASHGCARPGQSGTQVTSAACVRTRQWARSCTPHSNQLIMSSMLACGTSTKVSCGHLLASPAAGISARVSAVGTFPRRRRSTFSRADNRKWDDVAVGMIDKYMGTSTRSTCGMCSDCSHPSCHQPPYIAYFNDTQSSYMYVYMPVTVWCSVHDDFFEFLHTVVHHGDGSLLLS